MFRTVKKNNKLTLVIKTNLKFVALLKKCGENAQKKKIEEITSKKLTISIENTCLGMK